MSTYLVYLSLFSILSSTINASTVGSCQQPVYCSTDSSNCTLYLSQSVTFICECVYKNCTTAWKSNDNPIHLISGPEYTLQVTEDIAGVMTCNNNSGTFSWTVTVLTSILPKFVKPLQGHSFSNEIASIGDSSNPTCIICVNCSVTADPPPVVTWEYQTNPGVFNPVISNQSDPTSPYYVENNGQKLCYNDIRNYKSVNGITYQCTACNVAGSIYATFTGKVDEVCPLPEPGPLTTRGPVHLDGHDVTLKLYTVYQEESTFRVCQYNRSSHTYISCCYCDKSCKWGDLHCPDSGSPSCVFNTSNIGLYQFQIYTLNYPCFFNIGDPIDVDNSSSSSHKSDEFIFYIISFLGLLAIIILLVVAAGYCYRRRHVDNNNDNHEVSVTTHLLSAANHNYGGVDDTLPVSDDNTSTVPVNNTLAVPVDNTSAVLVVNTSAVPVNNTSAVPVDNTSAVTVDNTSAVSVNNTSAVPVDNTSAVPVENTSAVPVDNTSAVPVDNTSAVPVDNTSAVPVDNTSAVPVDNTSAVPVDNTSAVTVDNTSAVPVENTSAVPVDNISAVSVDNTSAVPVENTSAVPVDNISAVSVDNTSAVPVENISAVSVDNTSAVPVDNISAVSVENTSAVPVDITSAVPVDNTSAVPVDNISAVSVDNTSAVPVDITSAVPVDNTSAVPVDNISAVSVDNTSAVPVDNISAITVDNTSAVPVENTSAVPVDNISAVSVDNTSAVPVDNISAVSINNTSAVPVDNISAVSVDNTSAVPVNNISAVSVDDTSAVPVDDTSATNTSVTNNQLSLAHAGAVMQPISVDKSISSKNTSDVKLPLQATDNDKTAPIPSTCKALTYHCKKTVYITNGNDSEQWVVNKLIPFLEELNVNVVRISDAIPGKEQYSARNEFIKEANKAIIVISKIKEKAFSYDISRVLHKNPDPTKITIIPILYEDVTDSDIPEQISHLISIRNNDPKFVGKITKSIYS